MADRVSRRDFLNGVALTIAAGLTPSAQLSAQASPYPPALTGLRGHHPGSFETAHAFREGKTFPVDGVPVEEHYNLVVVGGGISGLAAAWFYRQRIGRNARILVLDNHDDFGGHAKRNEFHLDGRLLIGYGGSESLQSPKAEFSAVAKRLIRNLGIEIDRFETAFERRFYPSLGLSRAVFFARETFGRDTLVTGDPASMVADDLAGPAQCQIHAGFRCRFSDFRQGQVGAARPVRAKRRPACRQDCRAEDQDIEDHQLSRLSDEDLPRGRGGRQLLPGPHSRLFCARL
jgi:hypothetical protein